MISSDQENFKSICFYRRNKLTIYLVQQLLAKIIWKIYARGIWILKIQCWSFPDNFVHGNAIHVCIVSHQDLLNETSVHSQEII